MNASILPRYLLGSREAILAVAASRWAPIIGMVFVLSAGLAREYDGEDLIHEPWHALRPLGASLASGTLLFLIVHIPAMLRRDQEGAPRPPLLRAYGSFLGLFWMTAPMAWLYAIPYERFMDPVSAVELNLWTLALVAAWRVALMVRVVHVVYGIRLSHAFFLVMAFADVVAFAVLSLAPVPVIDVMGGVRSAGRDQLIGAAALQLMLLSFLSAPVWLIGLLVAWGRMKPRWPDLAPRGEPRSRGLLFLAVASVVAFLPLLWMSQPEQVNRREVERLLVDGEVEAAFAIMSTRSPSAYPPHWDPPPRLAYREVAPDLDEVHRVMARARPADWVAALYFPKIRRRFVHRLASYRVDWWRLDELVTRFEDGRWDLDEQAAPVHATARFLLEHDPDLGDEDRESLERLLRVLDADVSDAAAE